MKTASCFGSAHILLPGENIPLEKWGCVACDQFTSDRAYWEQADAVVGGCPSTLRLILPEVYLEDKDAAQRVENIHAAMDEYSRDVLTRAVDGFVYVERTEQSGRVRQGLVGKIDLEAYSYEKGARPAIRPSERTVTERIPPRMAVRRGAALETPHVMMLADDPGCTLIEPIGARKSELKKVYEGELMQGGGHIAGWAVEDPAMLAQYNVLSHRLDEALGVMQDIQQRDDNLYRVVLQADPVSDAIRKAGYGGTNRYEQLMDMANAELVMNTTQKMDMLNRQLYIQSKSFDEVVDLCKGHDEMLKCIPAIMPVSNKDLKKTASGYGTRIDPIYNTPKFHAGMDFSANIGTPVYATGDGKVIKAGWETGYGNLIQVDHGFGYVTWYAHLSKYKVRPGQKVVRGEVIGEVGNTGKSTGPHLHYEVHVKGKVQNPVNYYFMDLSAEDYDKMVQIAANHGKVFD